MVTFQEHFSPELLATAIQEAVIKTKMYQSSVELSGPQLLQACDDLVSYIQTLEQEVTDLRNASHVVVS